MSVVERFFQTSRILLVLLLALIQLFINVPAVSADTEVGGPIISDTTWTLANSPYIVIESIDVWEGVTLTVEPGVVIRFESGKKLQINGTLIARGTESQRITFTSNQTAPQSGDWGNIEFTDTSVDATFDEYDIYIGGSVLQYATVEYGGWGVGASAGAIYTRYASPWIDRCTVRYNQCSGIRGTGTPSTPIIISSNSIYDNDYSQVEASQCSGGGISAVYAEITDNMVHHNLLSCRWIHGGGISTEDSLVQGNLVYDNSVISPLQGDAAFGAGISAIRCQVINNIVTGNHASLAEFSEYYRVINGAGIYAGSSTLISNLVAANTTEVMASQGAGIYAGNSIIVDNTVIDNTNKYGYSEGGGLYASGMVRGNLIEGNTNTGGRSDGGGIFVSGDVTLSGNIIRGNSTTRFGGGVFVSRGVVMTNTIAANHVSVDGQGAGLYLATSSYYPLEIISNTIVANTGPMMATIGGVGVSSAHELHYNNIYSNEPYDLVIVDSATVSGTNNYWGTVSTVNILEQVYDWYDNSSRGKLLYIPYLQDPDPNAPVPPPLNPTADWQDGSVVLRWDPIPSTTMGYGYKIYYDTDEPMPPYEGTGLDQGDTPIDVGNVTEYTLTGLEEGVTYYVAITAYDTLGREGWYSVAVDNVASLQRIIYLPLVVRQD